MKCCDHDPKYHHESAYAEYCEICRLAHDTKSEHELVQEGTHAS